ncbi:capsular biosynthesis protein [Thiomonas sp.]|uniref:capsule biosynthesis protein n=1 Tax=Thiomonas sp. TaxID=2047785 RepID=UPI0026387185|nr:capsular biosynthesis protein [Thiomonas sp.]
MTDISPASAAPPHVVFLQGMPSPFYRQMAQHLKAAGWRVTRINLCTGDWLFWHGEDAVSYRGRRSQWPAFIQRFYDAHRVTHLVLLGENRRYHRQAVDLALQCGIQVVVNDFGYIRPDWITFERNGMSGGSLFPRDPQAIRALAAALPDVDWTPRYADSAFHMARGDLLHNLANLFMGWWYPFYRRSDRRPHTLIYTPASGLRLLTNRLRKAQTEQAVRALFQSQRPYYLFPLQLDFDFQIVAYSPFSGIAESIAHVVASFAQRAPKQAILVLKEHPWDPALKSWQRVLHHHARRWGVADRVQYLRGGHLDTLISHAQGVVTVNSTTGMRALHLGRPLVVLGEAIFDAPGLTHQEGLDSFWTAGKPPDAELVRAFLKAIAGTVQIRGVFFEPAGMHAAAYEAAQRLLHDRVGKLLFPIDAETWL